MTSKQKQAQLADNILSDFVANTDVAKIRNTMSNLLLAALCPDLEITPAEKIKLAEGYTIIAFLFDDIERYQAELAPIREFRSIKARS